jgi:hypothetical protein
MNMNFVRTAVAAIVMTGALAVPSYAEELDQPCAGTTVTVRVALEWASRDHGFNEGATCALGVLNDVLTFTGLPANLTQAILGNIWDRTNMMGAARTAAQAGFMDEAVDAAICSQIHNPTAEACLSRSGEAIAQWLLRP